MIFLLDFLQKIVDSLNVVAYTISVVKIKQINRGDNHYARRRQRIYN